MCNDIYTLLCYHTGYFHCCKNPLCSIYFSLLSTLWQRLIYLFTVSIVLPFSVCRIVGVIQYVVFSHWYLLLSNMYLRFLYVFFYGLIDHFTPPNIPLSERITVYLPIYLLKDVLVASSFSNYEYRSDTINIHVHVLCELKFSTPLGKYQES